MEYFRQKLSKGVTPQNNAAVAITQALGPSEHATPDEMRELEALLQIKLSEDGEYFQGYEGGYEEINSACTKPWDARKHPAVSRWLELNEKPLELLTEGASKSRIYLPRRLSRYGEDGSAHLVYSLIPFQGNIRQAAKALAARAMLRLARGQDKEASRDIMTIYRLARHVGALDLTPYNGLVSLSIESFATGADISFIRACRGKRRRLQEHLDMPRKIRPKRDLLERYDLYERMVVLDMIQVLASTPRGKWKDLMKSPGLFAQDEEFMWLIPIGSMPVEWNDALRKANRVFDMYTALMRGNLGEEEAVKLHTQFEAERARMETVTTQERITQRLKDLKHLAPGQQATESADLISDAILLKMVIWNFGKALVIQRRMALKRTLCQTALGLQIYQCHHSKYPEKLADLTPRILPKVPVDPFAEGDQPLRYTSDGKTAVVYSVGADGEDNGGTDLRFTAEADEEADAGYRLGPGTNVNDEK